MRYFGTNRDQRISTVGARALDPVGRCKPATSFFSKSLSAATILVSRHSDAPVQTTVAHDTHGS